MYYVYLLRLSNGHIYVGSTRDLKQRIKEHASGKSPATKGFLPCKLISYICVKDRITGRRLEAYLKSGSGRAFQKKRLGTAQT